MKSVLERFEEKIEPIPWSGCWIWMASVDQNGYGVFGLNKKVERAHRVSYTLYVDKIPEGKVIRHRCDNSYCVNPSHLEIGTQQENVADSVLRGRYYRGNQHHWSKLTQEDVSTIFALKASGMQQKEIASLFNVDPSNISHILRNKSWKQS